MTTNKPENSDRELLELAAKAAGYDTSHQWNADRMEMDPPVASLCIPGVSTAWNPLEEDGDALRLAVRLGITISFWGTWKRSRLTRLITERPPHKRATVRARPWPPAAPSSAPPLRWGGTSYDRRNPMGNAYFPRRWRSRAIRNRRRYSEPLP